MSGSRTMPPVGILLLSAAVGYISLSQEILWMRLLSYATGGAPEVFGHVLGVFLLGIALGALLGRRVCAMDALPLMAFVGGVLLAAAAVYYLSVPIIALFRERNYGGIPQLPRGLTAAYLLVWLVAFLQGGIFTVLCHAGVRSDAAVGVSVSWIYLANIVGSTAGPLFTGFVLLDVLTIQDNLLLMSIATAVLGAVVLMFAAIPRRWKWGLGVVAVALIVGFVALQGTLTHRVLETLQGWRVNSYAMTIQNRSGIIAIEHTDPTDKIFGGGAYDGRFDVDPDVNSNGIHRAHAVALLHPGPRRALIIGLSSGSWARVFADYTPIEKMTIVEINPGYLEAIPHYETHKPLLTDPDIDIVIDDGRRWLNRHPEARFDFILMNATHHWRSQSTNIQSREFLELIKAHMNPGGVIYWNTTGSKTVVYTAATVFEHVVRYSNFVAASDAPFHLPFRSRQANLKKFIRDGRPVLSPNGPGRRMFIDLLGTRLVDIGAQLRQQPPEGRLVTDDNMRIEYKNFDHRPLGVARWMDLRRRSPVDCRRGWWPTLRRVFGF